MRGLGLKLVFLIAASMASRSSLLESPDHRGAPNEFTSIVCLPFEKYENLMKEECFKSQEIIRLEEQKNSIQIEMNLKLVMSEKQVEALNFSMQALKENCELKMQIAEFNLNQAKLKLEECRGALSNETVIPPEIAAQLQHLQAGSYFISKELANWYMAGKLCTQYGLQLASIESSEENDELKKVIETGSMYWLSGTDLGSEGSFYWSNTAQPISSFNDWDANQPDNYQKNENCVHFWHSKGAKTGPFNWNDALCDILMKFICEKK